MTADPPKGCHYDRFDFRTVNVEWMWEWFGWLGCRNEGTYLSPYVLWGLIGADVMTFLVSVGIDSSALRSLGRGVARAASRLGPCH